MGRLELIGQPSKVVQEQWTRTMASHFLGPVSSIIMDRKAHVLMKPYLYRLYINWEKYEIELQVALMLCTAKVLVRHGLEFISD